jgi:hypothetical protein
VEEVVRRRAVGQTAAVAEVAAPVSCDLDESEMQVDAIAVAEEGLLGTGSSLWEEDH